jgi:S1-C subfamily serine protease
MVNPVEEGLKTLSTETDDQWPFGTTYQTRKGLLMSILRELSNALAGNIESLSPSIVRVEARKRLPATGIVWASDGVIVTSSHAVRDENIRVGLANGEVVPARLLGRDQTTDLALLQAEASLVVPTWSDMDMVKIGHLVLAVGRPHRDLQATLGIVSALGGSWRTPAGGKLTHYLQTDVVMYPGFSGGPLMDVEGHIIGLNTSGLIRGVSVAIPKTNLKTIAQDILQHGHVRRGYLGVAMQPVRLPVALAEKLGQETGLHIMSVEADSPAEAAGLVLGDTIVSFNGDSVSTIDALLAHLSGEVIGQTVPMQIIRGGELQTIEITVGEQH